MIKLISLLAYTNRAGSVVSASQPIFRRQVRRRQKSFLSARLIQDHNLANSEMLSQLGSFRHMTQSLHLPVLRLN
jgi:hypothetical protein